MSTIAGKPTLELLKAGDEFKTFTVTGKAGMEMPRHISTKEAVIIIREGNATLKIDGKEYELEAGGVFIIPGNKIHTLFLHSGFEAIVIMATDSEIEFH